ncbi:hypothetical protein ACFY05_32795 [Microtetraspora fusca]|uniref:C2H2-type domain-containing protein n=1 Tax=Microtetraspora fusca TaxID=1997 RepID=A0ABW6VE32_MICFU
MDMMQPYSHRVIPWHNDETGRLECRTCPRPIVGIGPTLRHHDEAVRHHTPDQGMAAAVTDATHLGAQALEAMWTDRCSDLDRARVVVEALEAAGALRPRNTWKRRRHLRAA